MSQLESICGHGQPATGDSKTDQTSASSERHKRKLPQWIIDSHGRVFVENSSCHARAHVHAHAYDDDKPQHTFRQANLTIPATTTTTAATEATRAPPKSITASLYWRLKSILLGCSHSRNNAEIGPQTFEDNKRRRGQFLNVNIVSFAQKPIRCNQKPGKEENGNHERPLDVDAGYAWIILAVMFLINASTFGTARAYGLIFEKRARQEEASRSLAALPFTIMGAVENMAGPVTGYLLTRTNSWRLTVFVGSCLITLAHLLAAIFDSLASQIVLMGLVCGLGLSFITISSFQINNAYFVRYRSRAFGLGLTGAAFGTFYISPLCQYVLNNYSINLCYLVLGLILLPNVPLSLLLRPVAKQVAEDGPVGQANVVASKVSFETISGRLQPATGNQTSLGENIWQVIKSPVFHLIWPTQLLFCWFNFVFGMVIVDFGEDRGLGCNQMFIPIWALGQLVGRLGLGSLVDMRFVTFRTFTVICFTAISLATWSLNRIHSDQYEQLILSLLVFILSMFIANLYILFNDLVEHHMEKSLTSLTIGISSFVGSFFLLPRASVIGHYRDTIGNYDDMFNMFSYISMGAALTWLVAPEVCRQTRLLWLKSRYRHRNRDRLRLSTITILDRKSFSGISINQFQ